MYRDITSILVKDLEEIKKFLSSSKNRRRCSGLLLDRAIERNNVEVVKYICFTTYLSFIILKNKPYFKYGLFFLYLNKYIKKIIIPR